MTDKPADFELGADGIDVATVTAEIHAAVDARIAAGEYADARLARAERMNLLPFGESGAGLGYYLRCLRDGVEVDISDFEIRERRVRLAPLLIRLKRGIWNLLKFYTYRLWSQQNQINSLLAAGMEGLEEHTAERLRRLEARVEELERRLRDAGPGPSADP